jgi:hypothetical protein
MKRQSPLNAKYWRVEAALRRKPSTGCASHRKSVHYTAETSKLPQYLGHNRNCTSSPGEQDLKQYWFPSFLNECFCMLKVDNLYVVYSPPGELA